MALDDLLVDSPHRPPDWRWQMATHVRRAGRFPNRIRDDESTAVACTFQTDLARPRDDWQRLELHDIWPDIIKAYNLRFLSDKPQVRYGVEARILSGQPYHEITLRTGVGINTLAWYEQFFFSVNDRINQADWVAHCIIGPALFDRTIDRDLGAFWRLAAYSCGSVAIDHLVSVLDQQRISTPDQYAAYTQRQVHKTTCTQALLSAATVGRRSDDYIRLQLLEVYARFKEVEQTAGDGGTVTAVSQQVGAFLGDVTWSVVRSTDQPSPRAIGLRAQELMALHCGGKLPPLDVTDMVYPDKAGSSAREG